MEISYVNQKKITCSELTTSSFQTSFQRNMRLHLGYNSGLNCWIFMDVAIYAFRNIILRLNFFYPQTQSTSTSTTLRSLHGSIGLPRSSPIVAVEVGIALHASHLYIVFLVWLIFLLEKWNSCFRDVYREFISMNTR
jgi:hypothetical protein